MLVGRGRELAALADVLETARAGRASSLLLVGDPGMGKTELLRETALRAGDLGMTVVSVTAVEAESDLIGSGLSLLLLRLGAGRPTDPASPWDLLAAVADQAASGPLAVVVDDVHWLDHASLLALGFTIRRLLADPVAVLMAARPVIEHRADLSDVPRLAIDALPDEAAVALLRARSPGTPLEAAQTIASALGRVPLALVEAPEILPADVMAGRAPVDQPVPVGDSIRSRYARGFDHLHASARRALVLAAASEPDDDIVLAEALRRDGVTAADLQAAEAVGLLQLTPQPVFRHPLVRSAVYASATAVEQRHAHRRLADVLREGGQDASWLRHAALGADAPDVLLACDLEAAAVAAGDSGDATAAAALAHRAAVLSPAGIDRWRRLVLAAEMAPADVASAAHARAVLSDCPDPALRARAALVLAELPIGLEEMAAALDRSLRDPVPPELAAKVAAARIYNAMHAADLETIDRLASTTAGTPESASSWQLCFALGTAYTFRAQHREGLAWMRRAEELTTKLTADDVALVELFDWATVLGWIGASVPGHRRRVAEAARRWRRTGNPALAANADMLTGEMARRDGQWAKAMAFWETGQAVAPTAGPSSGSLSHRMALVASAQGRRDLALAMIESADRRMELEGNEWERLWVPHCRGLLALTLGHPEQAIHHLDGFRVVPYLGRGCRDAVASSLVLLAEACAALGRVEDAIAAANDLEGRLFGIVEEHGLALVQRAHAVAGTDDPESRFRAALEHHGRADEPFDRARTQLLFGEWLRRNRHPVEARAQLRAALVVFETVQAGPWAHRARAELTATGELPVAPPQSLDDPGLTAQELRVALAVAEGLSNAQIGAALFLSVKTVEFHLTRVYRKLGVRSRGGVARALVDAGLAP